MVVHFLIDITQVTTLSMSHHRSAQTGLKGLWLLQRCVSCCASMGAQVPIDWMNCRGTCLGRVLRGRDS